jgi:hypothetical protein
MYGKIDALSILRFHERQLRARDWPVMSHVPAGPVAWEWIAANHRYNGLLWQEQDRARRLDLPPAEIAAGKRLIERYRQKRSDAADAIDAALPARCAGALIDRLSSLALDIHHMRAHAERLDACAEHLQACASRLEGLLAQRRDLATGLDTLLASGTPQVYQ